HWQSQSGGQRSACCSEAHHLRPKKCRRAEFLSFFLSGVRNPVPAKQSAATCPAVVCECYEHTDRCRFQRPQMPGTRPARLFQRWISEFHDRWDSEPPDVSRSHRENCWD